MTRYQIFCKAENDWISTVAVAPPTTCPNDVAHAVRDHVRDLGGPEYRWCEIANGVIALCDSEGVEVIDKNVRLLTETELVGEGKKVIRASPDGSRFYSKMLDDGTKEEGAEV